jgi:hypothetical protein
LPQAAFARSLARSAARSTSPAVRPSRGIAAQLRQPERGLVERGQRSMLVCVLVAARA